METSRSEARAGTSVGVVVVEPVGGHGGMDFWDHSLCTALAEANWRPLLLTSQALPDPARTYPAWEIFQGVFGPRPKWRRGLRHVGATVKGLWKARRLGARIAHFHFFHVGALQYFGVLVARMFGLRVVVSAHDVGSFRAGESRGILSRLYEASDAIVVYSARGREMLTATFGMPAEKVFVVPHGNYAGFLPPLPARSAAKAAFGYTSDEFVVLFFGQLKRVKRLDLLLEAAAVARSRSGDRIRLLVAGSAADSDMAAIDRLIADENLSAIVQLHARYIPNEELPRYLASADLAVLPYDNIYQSGVVLLAMTNGVPVLTSDIPGMLEVVDHGRTGLTFRAGDADDLANTLLAAAREEWNLADLSAEASRYVATRHSWTNCALATIKAYCATGEDIAPVSARYGATPLRGAS
ncbi:glycosyltransferase family 4 protein [Sphingomonas sp. RS2018]